MTAKNLLLALIATYSMMNAACAPKAENKENNASVAGTDNTSYLMEDAEVSEDEAAEDLNPFAENVEEKMLELDGIYQAEKEPSELFSIAGNNCNYKNRFNCGVYVQVVKNRQEMYLYVDGKYRATWAVSTGRAGFRTPNMETKPNGRIYQRYSSVKYPGGDYNGMGNMPYAVFIQGGFALHGTPDIKNLGRPASHGCIRLHPDNAWTLNNLIRQYGVSNTWVTVQDMLDSDRAVAQQQQQPQPKKKFWIGRH